MQNAIVTGATGGIGQCIAAQLAAGKVNLLITGRRADVLARQAEDWQRVYGIRVDYLAQDLAQPDAPATLHAFAAERGFVPDVLVNNAGYGLWGPFEEVPIEAQLDMLQVNVMALTALTHLFIPQLLSQPRSYLLNVASLTAYQAIPNFATYAASKAYVVSFSRALYHEYRKRGLRVTCLSPGSTDTGFLDRAGQQHLRAMADRFGMTPEVVARIALSALRSGKAEVVPGGLNKVNYAAAALLPKVILEKAAAKIFKKPA